MEEHKNSLPPKEQAEPDMGGWNAIADAFDCLYPNTLESTKQYGVLIPWMLGGNSPLDNLRAYDGGDYWHFVTFGLSELYEKKSEDLEHSGYGMEFTFKLKKGGLADEEREIQGVCGILQDLARHTFQDGDLFQPFEYVYTGQTQGIDTQESSLITGFITVPEPMLERIKTPNGEVLFVELVGATDAELRAIMDGRLRVRELYERLGTDITDYRRQSLV